MPWNITAAGWPARSPRDEIDQAFNALQRELEDQISARLAATRASLLENFDEEVHARLRMHHQQAAAQLGRLEKWLWGITCHELRSSARFDGVAAI